MLLYNALLELKLRILELPKKEINHCNLVDRIIFLIEITKQNRIDFYIENE